jgi:hypothetical protein
MDSHKSQSNFELAEESGMPRLARSSAGPVNVLVPTDAMRRAKSSLAVNQGKPIEDRELLAMHGWLSPDGTLYACEFEKHGTLADALGYDHESKIERAGYVKLTQLKWLVEARYCGESLTAAQWETIERWYEKNDFPEEHFIRLTAAL